MRTEGFKGGVQSFRNDAGPPPLPRENLDMRKLFLLEFNELTPGLIDRFITERKLPNFEKFRMKSTEFTTDAGEDPPYLEPWIAWPAIHSGVPYERHGAYHLGDGLKNPYPGIARLLSDAGLRVGVFGSMNTNYRGLNGYYLPDPWDGKRAPEPAALQPYFSFVSQSVRDHTSESGAGGGARAFVTFLLKNGLKPATLLRLVRQLIDERRSPDVRWRRATMLDHVQYDVFRALNAKFDVDFATYFSNSVAHFQHYFWRNMDPKRFDHPPSANDSATLAAAIELGYRTADTLLGRFMHDYPDATLVFCTALSQQPWTETTKCAYRPADFAKLLHFAGVGDAPRVIPVMAEEFELVSASESDAAALEEKLAALTFRSQRLLKAQRHGVSVFTGCAFHNPLEGANLDEIVNGPIGRARFRDLFYQISTMRSGRHHRDGILWVRDGSHRVVFERLPITEIAPMILKRFGVNVSASMRSSEAI